MWWFLLPACGSVGLEVWQPEEGLPHVEIEPRGRVEFPDTSPDGHSAEVEVSAENSGDAAAILQDAWIDGDAAGVFFLEDVPLPTQVAPGEGFAFPVHFLPSGAGAFEGTLVLESGDGGTVERLLLGSGCRDENRDGRC